MGHLLKDCLNTFVVIKKLSKHDLPFSIALKAEVNMLSKINSKLSSNIRKVVQQSYLVEEKNASTLRTAQVGQIDSPIGGVQLSPKLAIGANLEENEFDLETTTRDDVHGVLQIDMDSARFGSYFCGEEFVLNTFPSRYDLVKIKTNKEWDDRAQPFIEGVE